MLIQSFVALPDEVKVTITALVLWAVSFAFSKLLALVPALGFLEQFREPLALAIAAALIGWFEAAIPDAFAGVAVLAVQLVLAVLAALGLFKGLAASGVKAFK